MAKKTVNNNEGGGEEQPLVPIKIRRDTLKLIKLLSSWKDQTMFAYLHDLMVEKANEAAQKVADDLKGAK